MNSHRIHPVSRAQNLRRRILACASALALITLASCGGNGTDTPTANSAVIGAAGGVVTGPDGTQVVVPAGALDQPVTIRIARSSSGAPDPLDAYPVSGAIYEITPHDVSFNVPVTIRVPVGNLTDPQVFMTSAGKPWIPTTANISNGFAEWERISFSWTYVGACWVPPSMATDPYWCAHASSHALISATPSNAMTQTAFPSNPAQGSYGEYSVNQAATLQFSQLVKVPGNCSNVTVKFLRRSWADPLFWWSASVVAQTQTLATQSPVMTADAHYLTGTATITVPFSYLDGGHNQFVMAASYDCPNIVHTGPSTAGTYSWDTVNTHHTDMWGDGILVSGNVPTPTVYYTVGGTVSGLTGTGLVLQNNGSDSTPPINANGSFTFATSTGGGTLYNVTVLTQPSGQRCTVTNGSGTANANVIDVAVNCVNIYSIGGTVSGLAGTGLVLQNNGADDLTITASGAFTFLTGITAGSSYSVTVLTQPSGSTCTLQNASGTANANVTDVAVTCTSAGPLALVANSGVTNGTNGLSVYRANPSTGVLSFLSNVNAGNTPYAVAVSPNGLYAYVTNQMGGTVSSYSIDNVTGAVSLIPLSSPGSNNASGIAMDRLGRFIWVANYGYSTLSTFSIGANGVLAPVGSPMATTSSAYPYAITAHPTMDFVYVAHQSNYNYAVTVYSVNPATGALTLLQTLTNAITSPSGIVIDPSGRFAYAISQNGGISAFAINASTGLLTTIGSVGTGGATFAIAVNPNGQYLYVTNGSSSSNVVVFAINQITGALTAVGSPYSAGNNPRGVTVNAAGTYLYVTNYSSNDVSAFSISGGGGTLISLGATVATGSQPQGIAVTP